MSDTKRESVVWLQQSLVPPLVCSSSFPTLRRLRHFVVAAVVVVAVVAAVGVAVGAVAISRQLTTTLVFPLSPPLHIPTLLQKNGQRKHSTVLQRAIVVNASTSTFIVPRRPYGRYRLGCMGAFFPHPGQIPQCCRCLLPSTYYACYVTRHRHGRKPFCDNGALSLSLPSLPLSPMGVVPLRTNMPSTTLCEMARKAA